MENKKLKSSIALPNPLATNPLDRSVGKKMFCGSSLFDNLLFVKEDTQYTPYPIQYRKREILPVLT